MKFVKKYLVFLSLLFALNLSSENIVSKNFVEGELLVRFRGAETELQGSSVFRSLNLSIIKRFKLIENLYHLRLPFGVDTLKAIEMLSSFPEVLYVEPNYLYKALLLPDDPGYSNQWALPKIGAPIAWDYTTGSKDVVVAVIDTGIDYNHPDLADSIWRDTQNNPGYNAINNSNDPMDNNSHGTHCAGIIGAIGDNGIGVCGINWQIDIMALKFLDASGNGTLANAIKCIEYLIDRYDEGENIVAVSNSWGGDAYSGSLYNAISQLSSRGILFIAAAGNSSRDNDITPLYPAGYNLWNIISVASSEQGDDRSYFSNYGKDSVDLAAPGTSIYSTFPNESYGYKSGTSMATPLVAGVAALLSVKTDEMDASELKRWLLYGVERLPQWSNLTTTGGRLNLLETFRVASLAADILPITDFSAERIGDAVHLSWQLPQGAQSIIIRRLSNRFPLRWDDGDEVYIGATTSFVDEDTQQGIPYYYSAWAYYGILQDITEEDISPAVYAYTNTPPYKPECILPQNETVGISIVPLLKATGFVDADNDKHLSSRWQISTNITFDSVVWDKITTGLTEVTVDSGILASGTSYYWRVRYKDSREDWSEWADASHFTTLQEAVRKKSGGGCFIATAAFDSAFDPRVKTLKEFRDRRLLTNTVGKAFVRWYYKNSPRMACYINNRKYAKIVVRSFLRPVIWLISLLRL